jgi:hypothetical protein
MALEKLLAGIERMPFSSTAFDGVEKPAQGSARGEAWLKPGAG